MSRDAVRKDSLAGCEREEAAQTYAADADRTGQRYVKLAKPAEHSLDQGDPGHDPRGKITALGLQHHTYDMVVKALLTPSQDDSIGDVVDTVVQVLNVDYGELLELTDYGQRFVLRAGSGFDEGALGTHVGIHLESQAGYTLLRRRPVVVSDLEVEDRFDPNRLLTDHDVTSGVTVPLISPSDDTQMYGVLGVHSRTRRTFNDWEVSFLQEAARILAEAERRRREESNRERELQSLRKKAERLARDEKFLREALEVLRLTRDVQMVADCAAQVAVGSSESSAVNGLADWAFVDLLDDDSDVARIQRCAVAHKGDTKEAEAISKDLLGHYPIDLSARQGTARVYWTRRPVLIPEVNDDIVGSVARDPRGLDAIRRLRATSYLGVPLLHGDGRLLGILSLVRSSASSGFLEEAGLAVDHRPFNSEDERLAENLAGAVSMALVAMLASAAESHTTTHLATPALSPQAANGSANPEIVAESQAFEPAASGLPSIAHQTTPKAPDDECLRARKILSQLSPMQREVFERLAQLKSNKAMSEEFCIEPTTVKSHVEQIKKKLGLPTREDTVRAAQSIFHVAGDSATD